MAELLKMQEALRQEEMRLMRENVNIERQKKDQIRQEMTETEKNMGEVVAEILE